MRQVVDLRCQRIKVERPHDEGRGQLLHDLDKDEQRRGEQATRQYRHVNARQRFRCPAAEAARRVIHRWAYLEQSGIHGLQPDGEEAHDVGEHQRCDAAGQQQPWRNPEHCLQPGGKSIVQPRERRISVPTAMTSPGIA